MMVTGPSVRYIGLSGRDYNAFVDYWIAYSPLYIRACPYENQLTPNDKAPQKKTEICHPSARAGTRTHGSCSGNTISSYLFCLSARREGFKTIPYVYGFLPSGCRALKNAGGTDYRIVLWLFPCIRRSTVQFDEKVSDFNALSRASV